MSVAYLSDGAMQLVHYDLTEAELGACLDDLIELMPVMSQIAGWVGLPRIGLRS